MAIFEKLCHIKNVLDDTDNVICTLENAQNISNHIEYVLRIQRGPCKENKWTVSHRYRDFASLHLCLQQTNIDLPLPPKKLIGNMQPSFVAERQIALQNYINEVLKHQILALSLPVRRFMDPNNYPINMAEEALQTISIALRGDGQYELKGPLQGINWRIRKHYFYVVDSEKTNCLLAWQSYGPDKHLHNKDLQTALKSLQNVSHPYIDEILTFHVLESGVYIVRRLHESGTMRDLLYGTDYEKSYLAKYGNPKVRKPFTTNQIVHYGYQILQALKFLHDKGLPHGHIHPGNIVIDNQRVLLLDIENILLGVPSFLRPYLRELRRASAEAVDVYAFGRAMYEMAYAETFEGCYCEQFQSNGFSQSLDDLESLLHSTLSSSSWKQGGPTLDELLDHPLFTRTLNGLRQRDVKGHLKFPLTLKEQIKEAVLCVETRLKIDQKLLRSARRELRIQAILGSEEEMRKQRKRVQKKRDSVWKSTSSLASRSASTASSPTPPATATSESSGFSPPQASGGRGALLQAISSFDKKSLARVKS